MKILIFTIVLFVISLFILNILANSNIPIEKSDMIWYESSVQVNYQNGTIDTVEIDISDYPNNIKLDNGDLSYFKPTKRFSGASAGKSTIGSYVRSFKILKSHPVTLSE